MTSSRKPIVLAVALSLLSTVFSSGLTSATAATGCAGPAPGGNWPSYGHDLRNTRNQPDEHKIGTSNVTSLAPAWKFSIASAEGKGNFQSTPVIANGCVYVGTSEGSVFAL